MSGEGLEAPDTSGNDQLGAQNARYDEEEEENGESRCKIFNYIYW